MPTPSTPAGAYFTAKGYINAALARRLGILFLMGGTQGLVGWWMVRSGLKVSGAFPTAINGLQLMRGGGLPLH